MVSTSTTNIIATATASGIASSTSVATEALKVPHFGEEIFDIAGTASMAYPWLNFAEQILLWVIGLGMVIGLYKWLTAPVERKRKQIVQSPEVQALRAIKRMRLSEFWEKRNLKAVCENSVAILKNYAYETYKISIGAAATSDEFIPALINSKVKNEVLATIKSMLNYCDEVRYTGKETNGMSQEELVNILEKLINTKGWRK